MYNFYNYIVVCIYTRVPYSHSLEQEHKKNRLYDMRRGVGKNQKQFKNKMENPGNTRFRPVSCLLFAVPVGREL